MFQFRIRTMVIKQLTICLMLTITTGFCFDENSNSVSYDLNEYRLPANVVPIHYDIILMPHIEEGNFTFDGETVINIHIHYTTQHIHLHSVELKINEVVTTLIEHHGAIYKPIKHSYDMEKQFLILTFHDKLEPGLYKLELKFLGTLSDEAEGFFRLSDNEENSTDTKWIVLTQFEEIGARRAFPCWDEPALKATFNISVKHGLNNKALSNMPIRKHHITEDGMVFTNFYVTPVMSTYLVAAAVLNYGRASGNETAHVWSRISSIWNMRYALTIADRSAQFMISYTGIAEVLPKVDHVAVQYFPYDGMENWGLVIYREMFISYNERADSTAKKMVVASLVAHEVVHQWFGNLVTPSWWSHLWLKEGFAMFFQSYIIDKLFNNEWQMMNLAVVESMHECLREDTDSKMNPVILEVNTPEEINSISTPSAYDKGRAILRMMFHIISEKVFQNGIIKYLKKHKFSSANSDALWMAMQAALDESDVSHDYDIKQVMDSWTKQSNYPVVIVTRNYETGKTVISQKQLQSSHKRQTVNNQLWSVPVTFTTQTDLDFSNTIPTHWLKTFDRNIFFEVSPNDWIIVNIQQTGYYRVNYDRQNWNMLADYLNSENYMKIHVLNRAQIVEDASFFLLNNQLSLSIYMKIIGYLPQDRNYVVWCPMFNIVSDLSKYFYLQIKEIGILKSYLSVLFDELFDNIGYKEKFYDHDLSRTLRYNAFRWACKIGSIRCKTFATTYMIKDLAESQNMAPWWEKEIYCNGMMMANHSTWSTVMSRYSKTRDLTLLAALSCSEDYYIIITYLNKITNRSFCSEKEQYYHFIAILTKQAHKIPIQNYILENFEIIRPRFVSASHSLSHIIANIYSQNQLSKVNQFVTQYPNLEHSRLFKEIEKRKVTLGELSLQFPKVFKGITEIDIDRIMPDWCQIDDYFCL